MTNSKLQAEHDYAVAKAMGLVGVGTGRWCDGVSHHAKSERLLRFMQLHDGRDYNFAGDNAIGGYDNNSELLLLQMDAFFEMLDRLEDEDPPDACA